MGASNPRCRAQKGSSRESLRHESHGDQELRGAQKAHQERSRANKVVPRFSRLTKSVA